MWPGILNLASKKARLILGIYYSLFGTSRGIFLFFNLDIVDCKYKVPICFYLLLDIVDCKYKTPIYFYLLASNIF